MPCVDTCPVTSRLLPLLFPGLTGDGGKTEMSAMGTTRNAVEIYGLKKVCACEVPHEK